MKKTAKSLIEVVVDVTCDACGVSVVPELHKTHHENLDNFEGFGVLQASFGYGSDRDGENFHFDLCQACFERLVDTVENLRTAHGVRG